MSHSINPFAVVVRRHFDIQALLWLPNLTAVIGAISLWSTAVVGLYERFHFAALGTIARRTVRVVFWLTTLLSSSCTECKDHEQEPTKNAHNRIVQLPLGRSKVISVVDSITVETSRL
jgi:hypothetical protein